MEDIRKLAYKLIEELKKQPTFERIQNAIRRRQDDTDDTFRDRFFQFSIDHFTKYPEIILPVNLISEEDIQHCNDPLKLDEYIRILWNLLRASLILKEPKEDLELNPNKELITFQIKDHEAAQKIFEQANRSVADLSYTLTQGRSDSLLSRSKGLHTIEHNLIVGFEGIQRIAIAARLRILSMNLPG